MFKNTRKFAYALPLLGLVTIGARFAHADPMPTNTAPEKPAVIRFADLGGIENWRAEGDRTLLIEGHNKQWYKADMMGPCTGLGFANTIGFVADPMGNVDRFSSVYVDGQRCYFRTFEKTDAPAKDAKTN
tara:strand:- start:4218 stop:4607 length:390 start_codon:yes stop_codon:yes gene_type:complete